MNQNIHIIEHAVIHDRMTILRDKNTPTYIFRQCLNDIALILAVEATRHLPVEHKRVETPLAPYKGSSLVGTPLIVPILRAGLALSDSLQRIIPHADIGHIGLARDHDTHEPLEYLNRLPENLDRPVFVVDPMLATAGSMLATLEILKAEGANMTQVTIITLVCAPEGLDRLYNVFPEITVYAAAIDSHLDDSAYIVPGLGDAGDRYFGTD